MPTADAGVPNPVEQQGLDSPTLNAPGMPGAPTSAFLKLLVNNDLCHYLRESPIQPFR